MIGTKLPWLRSLWNNPEFEHRSADSTTHNRSLLWTEISASSLDSCIYNQIELQEAIRNTRDNITTNLYLRNDYMTMKINGPNRPLSNVLGIPIFNQVLLFYCNTTTTSNTTSTPTNDNVPMTMIENVSSLHNIYHDYL
jgi:hypothetical protein